VVTTTAQSATRRAILLTIKKRGEARAEELAQSLGITPSAIRQHLGALVGERLVAVREQRGAAGRPKHFYSVTSAAEEMFPKTYGDLTCELLTYIKKEEPRMVDHIFDQRRLRRGEQARARLAGKSFEERVAELARILDEDGYLADVERGEDGTWRIVEHNCAILEVALRYGQACSSEINFLRDVMPDADIDRVSHMASGGHHCAYVVKPKAKPARTQAARAPKATKAPTKAASTKPKATKATKATTATSTRPTRSKAPAKRPRA
jgi:DeoR family suf operon transcriptional repressor